MLRKIISSVVLCTYVLLITLVIDEAQSQKTNFVNHLRKLEPFDEPQWFLDNIPFVELPVKEIEEVYYYRWSSLKRHLRYTFPGVGYIVTEFVHKVDYSNKFDTINAAAGHHINEARWLRDRRYVQDYINFWSREGGNANAYSEWIASSAYKSFLVDGDVEFIKSQQSGLVRNYDRWGDHFNSDWGLYWITPHLDAMEYSCSSVQTGDQFGGGVGYRPSFNAEMYDNARAIASIALLNGDSDTATDFSERAESLKGAILEKLWDPERQFFYHGFRDDNANQNLLDSREEIGFYPWQFQIVPKDDVSFTAAWEQLFDPKGFNTPFGPTTCEVRSAWYDGNQTDQCCWWNGNSWPYSTSLVLNSLAVQVREYGNSAAVGVAEYVDLLHQYALTQYKNGKPYVAECHSPVGDFWVCDSFNHSEHYAHSTYTDNVLSELIGIEPQPDDTFQINPIVPNKWRFFAAENIPYHGHEITVLYDADGSFYESGHSGLQVFVDGKFVQSQDKIGRMTVPISHVESSKKPVGGAVKIENYASNPNSGGYPRPTVSFNAERSSEWHPLDGRIMYDFVPTNRWSNWGSGNPSDWYAVNFGPGRSKFINQVKLYIYSDVVTGEGGVDCPKNMTVEIFDQTDNSWIPATNQRTTPAVCSPNDVNTIDFDTARTEQVRIVFTRDVDNDYYVGITELEIWAEWPQAPPNTYEAEDGLLTGGPEILRSTSASGGSYVRQIDYDGSSVEFTGVWVDAARDYSVNVFYANAWNSTGTHHILLNNEREVTLNYPPTAFGWGNFTQDSYVTFQAALQRGNNVIIFRKGDNYAELDRIEILV